MKVNERRLRSQRNAAGDLVYRVGFAGNSCRIEDDLSLSRKPKNEAEGLFYEQMQANGWSLTKRGWPDFLCVRDGKLCAVEVKPRSDVPLKKNQLAIMGLLSAHGIACYKWTPDGGFEEVKGVQR